MNDNRKSKANQRAIKKWYRALKSGKYPQAVGQLRKKEGRKYGYCCWGVACDLSNVTGWKWEGEDFAARFNTKGGMPPDEVMDWLGISDGGMHFMDIPEEHKNLVITLRDDVETANSVRLDTLNDIGVPFDVIADIVWYNYGEGEPPDA